MKEYKIKIDKKRNMNSEKFAQHFEKVVERSKNVLIKKRNEYAKDNDVFSNFTKATGISLHNKPSSVLWEYLVKHLQSCKDILQKIENEQIEGITKELLDEKFGDIINYFILLEGLVIEELNLEKYAEDVSEPQTVYCLSTASSRHS